MAVFETWLKSDLKKPVVPRQIGVLFSEDIGANKIGVEVTDDGQSAEITGAVTGSVIRADGVTVTVNGSSSGNKAYIILPEEAYDVVGDLSIFIREGTTTIGACTASVIRTITDSSIEPELPTAVGVSF